MDHIRGKTYDQLEVVDWEEASLQVRPRAVLAT